MRKILHIDLDAFFCACEELEDPTLRGTVFAVGGSAEGRGVISTCSYAARALGIHSGMPTAQAMRICPSLNLIRGSHGRYGERSRSVMVILQNYTPIMEQISVDEAFLDISDMRESNEEVARMIQREIFEKTHLPCSLGGSTNKLTAKMANTIGKKRVKTSTYPQSINCIPAGEEAAFLAPLPVGKLWGVGDHGEKRLRDLGITTIGQLAAYPVEPLVRHFGKYALELHEHANGRDDSPVHSESEAPKSVSQETTFERDVDDRQRLSNTMLHQSEQVGYRLRKHGLKGNTVRLKLRWGDFTTITRQVRLPYAINQDLRIFEQASALFDAAWEPERKPIRLIGVGVSGFESEEPQLTLFGTNDTEKEDRLLEAVDNLRTKYGKSILKRGIE